MLSAVKIGLHLAKKSAGLHGCKREVAALTAICQRIHFSAASRVRCAGLTPALDSTTKREFPYRISGYATFMPIRTVVLT